jgi:hypothetical protein
VFTRFHNLLRGCLLSVGVSNRKATVAVPQPFEPAPVATNNIDDVLAVDADDQLSAWEQDRANTLRDAEDSEQQGQRHLTRAALLRLIVQFEDEGLFVVAHELRQQADVLEGKRVRIAEMQLADPTF